MLIDRADSIFLVIDMQARLLPAIEGGEAILDRAMLLAETARRLGVPILATEQNPAGLGGTVPALAAYVEAPIRKRHFNACAGSALLDRLSEGRKTIVAAGAEAHVCVLQTALDLRRLGYSVFVVVDATGSRCAIDKETALGRIAAQGCAVVTAEMVAFEWLALCDDPQFREILALIKPR